MSAVQMIGIAKGTPAFQTLRFPAMDGFQLAGDLFVPAGPIRAAVLIAPAMGVRRRFYSRFAAFLAEAGAMTLSLDYRGMGDSRPGPLTGFDARLSDWAELDLAGAARELGRRAHGAPLLWVGHSVGGQLLGLLPDLPVRRALLVGSQSGYFNEWGGVARLGMAALWHVAIPLLCSSLGYFPMSRVMGGEDIPRGVAEQWASWGRRREYILAYLRERDGQQAFRYAGPLRAYAFSDDGLAPRRAVESLLAKYPRADAELRFVRPAAVGQPHIGHFGLFGPKFRSTLWAEARQWLLAGTARRGDVGAVN